MWKNSPKSLKKSTTVLSVIFFVASIIAIIGYIVSLPFTQNMIILYTFHGGAILTIVISIRLEPRIINILPFVANRLLVLNRTSGILLFEYAWTDTERKSLSSFIHGLQKVSQEKFEVGYLKGLELDEGIVILEHSEKLTYALLTTKSTKYLELCLRNFRENFEKEILKKKISLEGVVDTSKFEFGNKLIQIYFKYIPSRLDK